ncbi:hypothetical protein HELRODRAFT_176126 [Helobdella robusta]|uniref:Uncharacterized protein n=1 Tax=Helobdella robusta TaxID=6412 RepID=T1FA63_HELRO|nr:hypothetical protein HELRODRAFT_176126 [Helobdella robusta]ESO00267.1 hypothetical protein HELRODRAFT_176126 [Helobdella robusta]
MSLVTAKAEVGALDAWGRTPLHYAAAFDQDGRIVEYFLHNNVGATCRDNEGYTPTHYSAFYGKRASLEIQLLKFFLLALVIAESTILISNTVKLLVFFVDQDVGVD